MDITIKEKTCSAISASHFTEFIYIKANPSWREDDKTFQYLVGGIGWEEFLFAITRNTDYWNAKALDEMFIRDGFDFFKDIHYF